MTKLETKISNEIEHGKKISKNAEDIWGWSSPAGQIRAQRRAAYFIDLAKLNAQSKALEIGCGTGLFTKKVYEKTKAQITAIDISEDLLAIAKKKLPELNFKIDDAMALTRIIHSDVWKKGCSLLFLKQLIPKNNKKTTPKYEL